MTIVDQRDRRWLLHVIEASAASRAAGNHPFAAAVVASDDVVLSEGWNLHGIDRTSHAEMVALRHASAQHPVERLRDATLYSSAEPCAMCAGAAYWTGVGRVVYALSEASLLELTGAHPDNPTLSLPCRVVLAAGQRAVEIVGPSLEAEARVPHSEFWR